MSRGRRDLATSYSKTKHGTWVLIPKGFPVPYLVLTCYYNEYLCVAKLSNRRYRVISRLCGIPVQDFKKVDDAVFAATLVYREWDRLVAQYGDLEIEDAFNATPKFSKFESAITSAIAIHTKNSKRIAPDANARFSPRVVLAA